MIEWYWLPYLKNDAEKYQTAELKLLQPRVFLKWQIWLIWHVEIPVGNPSDPPDNPPVKEECEVCVYVCVCVWFASKKESEVCRLAASQRQQVQQAQTDLEEFRLQIERSSAEMYQHMKSQVDLWSLAVSLTVCTERQWWARIALHEKPISELWTTERHLPYGITQCYLPPNTGGCAPP